MDGVLISDVKIVSFVLGFIILYQQNQDISTYIFGFMESSSTAARRCCCCFVRTGNNLPVF